MNCTKRLMKREAEVKQIVRKEVEKELTARQDEIQREAAYQAMAVTFYILSRDFGFGKQRLASLKDAIEDEFALMDIGILGKEYNALHVFRHLKEKYGIDFNESKFDKKVK